jgi:hypothetical protein
MRTVIVASVTIKSLGGPKELITLGFTLNNVAMPDGLTERGALT